MNEHNVVFLDDLCRRGSSEVEETSSVFKMALVVLAAREFGG